ncbi:MAG TPA: helix-turn-helix domain-containing protein [Burkholderiaceae bacterium]|nr:helix-turn-helix domain-containing protein [Burkholderiaceae bacterium]HQR70443.1 helix-turn-helix domain-containing protein [Burkholderiaceae bacterium]
MTEKFYCNLNAVRLFLMPGVRASLSPIAQAVLLELARRADKAGASYPSIETLAEWIAVSRSSAQRAVDEIGKAGYLKSGWSREDRKGGRGKDTTLFVLDFEAIANPVNLTEFANKKPGQSRPETRSKTRGNSVKLTTEVVPESLPTSINLPHRPSVDTPKGGNANTRTRIPDDFELTKARFQRALAIGLYEPEVQSVFDKFRDAHTANVGPRAMKPNWDRGWDRWCKDYIAKGERSAQPPAKPKPSAVASFLADVAAERNTINGTCREVADVRLPNPFD